MVAVLVGTKCEISNQLSAVSNDIPIKNINSEKENIVFQKIALILQKIKAFFVYCKVVKEKEYSSFPNR